MPEKGGITFDSLKIAFGQDVLLLQDLATIFLIRDNMGKRPIFFSWSDGGYPDQTLGLSEYLVSQGFVRKLMSKPVVPNDSIVLSPSLGYLDLPRTEKLLWDVYHWKSAARNRPRGWVDSPSGSILQLYAVVYGGASRAFASAGQAKEAARADSVAKEVTRNLEWGEPVLVDLLRRARERCRVLPRRRSRWSRSAGILRRTADPDARAGRSAHAAFRGAPPSRSPPTRWPGRYDGWLSSDPRTGRWSKGSWSLRQWTSISGRNCRCGRSRPPSSPTIPDRPAGGSSGTSPSGSKPHPLVPAVARPPSIRRAGAHLRSMLPPTARTQLQGGGLFWYRRQVDQTLSRGSLQYLANLLRECVRGEGFLNECRAGIQDPVMENGAIGVA